MSTAVPKTVLDGPHLPRLASSGWRWRTLKQSVPRFFLLSACSGACATSWFVTGAARSRSCCRAGWRRPSGSLLARKKAEVYALESRQIREYAGEARAPSCSRCAPPNVLQAPARSRSHAASSGGLGRFGRTGEAHYGPNREGTRCLRFSAGAAPADRNRHRFTPSQDHPERVPFGTLHLLGTLHLPRLAAAYQVV